MTKYETFLQENRPAGFDVPAEWLTQMTGRLGLWYEDNSNRLIGEDRVLRDDVGNAVSTYGILAVVYIADTTTSGVVVYRPHLSGWLSSVTVGGGLGASVMERLNTEVQTLAPEVTVPLPERVVTMPTPPLAWVDRYEGVGEVTASLMFESEARRAINSYIADAEAAIAVAK